MSRLFKIAVVWHDICQPYPLILVIVSYLKLCVALRSIIYVYDKKCTLVICLSYAYYKDCESAQLW